MRRPLPSGTRVAVLIPCYDEEQTIGRVVQAFRATLPEATGYVYDNNFTDRTREIARSAGAVVGNESLQGKGHVVRRMFGDVEADVYVLVDGDDTYDPAGAPILVGMLLAFLSLVSGLILDTVTLGRREMKRMWYPSIPGPGAASNATARRRRAAPGGNPEPPPP